MSAREAYCTGCGRPRPVLYESVDRLYPIVQCGSVKRPGTLSREAARAIIKERRARRKAIKALVAKTYPQGAAEAMKPVR